VSLLEHFASEHHELKLFFSFYTRTDDNAPMRFQVTGELELVETLKELFGDSGALGARQRAAKDAFSIMSDGVVNRVWNLVCRFAINIQTDSGIVD
jgi:hypothetical protein